MQFDDVVRAELNARGIGAADVEVLVASVSALINIWGNAAVKKAAAAGAAAADKIVTEDDAEKSQRNLL
jgi:hypothetical protein